MDIVHKLASPVCLYAFNVLILVFLGLFYRNELHVWISFFFMLLLLYYILVGRFLDHTTQAYVINVIIFLFLFGLFLLLYHIKKTYRNIFREDLSVHLVLVWILFICGYLLGVKTMNSGLPCFVAYLFSLIALVIGAILFWHKSHNENNDSE